MYQFFTYNVISGRGKGSMTSLMFTGIPTIHLAFAHSMICTMQDICSSKTKPFLIFCKTIYMFGANLNNSLTLSVDPILQRIRCAVAEISRCRALIAFLF